MDVLHSVADGLNYLAVHVPWGAVAASGILSPILLGIKKWFSVQSEKVMITLVGLVAVAAAGLHYLMTVPTHDPSIIVVQGFVLAFMTQPFYFFIVKPIAAAVSEQLAQAEAFRTQIKSATETPPVPAEDFSH